MMGDQVKSSLRFRRVDWDEGSGNDPCATTSFQDLLGQGFN